jgi:uncharacterized protein
MDGAGVVLRAVTDGVTLAVRVQPAARKTSIVGVYGAGASAQLKIAVQAPPLEGRANAVLVEFLAEFFGIPRHRIEFLSGQSSRSKVMLIRGVPLDDAERLLAHSRNS